MSEKNISFTRNNYYFGKLLSVADFELEQSYIINKINLSNKLLLKTGIVSGLKVKSLDTMQQKIVVEPGVCVDSEGRIMIVHDEIIQNLSDIKGYDIDRESDQIFLSLKYKEFSQGEAYALDDSSNNIETFNHIIESYELVLIDIDTDSISDCVPLAKLEIDRLGTEFERINIRQVGLSQIKENIGTLEMNLLEEEVIISDSIDHELGPGKVLISLSLEVNDGNEKCTFQGDAKLLKDLDIEAIEYGVIVYEDKGSFKVIAKNTETKVTKFNWHAKRI